MTSELQALQARLARLEDQDLIRGLVIRIAAGVDRYDEDALRSAIWPDAVIDMGGAPISGAAFVAALAPPATPSQGRMHLTGNHMIVADGEQAHCESYVISVQEIVAEGGTETRWRAGRYLDRFERRDGRWGLSRRVFVDEWSRLDPVGERPNIGARRGLPAPHDSRYSEFLNGSESR